MSPVITESRPRQLTLELDENLATRHRNVRDVVLQGVARYLGDEGHARDHALGQMAEILRELPAMLAAASAPLAADRKSVV